VLLTLLMHVTDGLVRVNFSGADETRYMGLLVLVYVITAVIVVLLTGKNLGRKDTQAAQAELQPTAAAV
jgi:hypothetical protein